MKLYFADIKTLQPHHAALLSPERLEKARRYRMRADYERSVAAGVLLRYALGDRQITRNAFGKPVCEGACFNLSHSGDYVILALDSVDVGCDIEKMRLLDALRMGKYVYCEREMELLRGSADRLGCFFELWTKKEALLKCIGKGFHREAKSVDVSGAVFHEDGDAYALRTYRFADYTVAVCAKNKSPEAELIRVNLRSIPSPRT